MNNDKIIVVDNATVQFNIASEKVDNLKEYFIKLMKHQLYFEEFLALKNISLEIKRGESWGLVGRNGAGKSTLLKLICGILTPHTGSVTVNGTIAPMIELGAGLDSRLTAGENIYLNGALLGHSKKFMKEHFDEIVDFAELHNFLDMPIKNYSSGMRARLGFAIATTVVPDILIVDEVLSVGDAAFRKKCEKRMEEMLSAGTTLLYVSHNEREIERLCEKSIWLENGEIAMMGTSSAVCTAYTNKLKGIPSPSSNIEVPPPFQPKLTVVGAGYVGLVTSAAMASKGYQVTCLDVDQAKIHRLQNGECPLFEPGLDELLSKHRSHLHFTTDCEAAYSNADAIIVAVGTPETEDGAADLSYVYHALEDIAKEVNQKCMVIIKSTVPVGTNTDINQFFKKNKRPKAEFHIISNPEFLSQGSAVKDMLHASRIVVGVETKEAQRFMENLYRPFNSPLLIVGCASAEMIKYASNDFLALKISYINEIANLCEKTGANILEVANGMGKDPRIGSSCLNAGIGYGGSCFPKDTKALHWLASSHGYDIQTIRAAIDVNEAQKLKLIEKAHKYYPSLKGLTVAILGVTFKPNTDDLREAPSLINASALLEEGAKLKIWDPCAAEKFAAHFHGDIQVCDSIETALQDADLCMIFTEWDAIRQLVPAVFEEHMKKPLIFDGRNCYSMATIRQGTCTVYESIGRKTIRS